MLHNIMRPEHIELGAHCNLKNEKHTSLYFIWEWIDSVVAVSYVTRKVIAYNLRRNIFSVSPGGGRSRLFRGGGAGGEKNILILCPWNG